MRLTVPSWFTVTSSILALKWGVQGGSTTVCEGRPIVGDGRVKSMLGGGICDWKATHIEYSYFYNCRTHVQFELLFRYNICNLHWWLRIHVICNSPVNQLKKKIYFTLKHIQVYNMNNHTVPFSLQTPMHTLKNMFAPSSILGQTWCLNFHKTPNLENKSFHFKTFMTFSDRFFRIHIQCMIRGECYMYLNTALILCVVSSCCISFTINFWALSGHFTEVSRNTEAKK